MGSRLSVILAFFCLVSIDGFGRELRWTETNGPYGGTVNVLWTHPEGTVYGGTSSGEIYRSDPASGEWTLVTAALPERAILCFAAAEDSMYVGTDGVGVWRSDDAGEVWEAVGADSMTYPAIRSLAFFEGQLCAATTGGVARLTMNPESEDRPYEWRPILRELRNTNTRDLEVVGDALYAATHGGVFRYREEAGQWQSPLSGMRRKQGDAFVVRCIEN